MVGVSRIEIQESTDQLKHLMHLQTSASAKERFQVLYLLKSLQAKDISTAAQMVGRDRTTVQRWLLKYEAHGIEKLMAPRTGQGCKLVIPEAINQALVEKLDDPNGMSSYLELQQWLETEHQLQVKYPTVHRQVRYRLGAKLKVPRPVNESAVERAQRGFRKHLPHDWA
ncbi:helix-turn-helix domain-containing protein [Cyanobacteria bacterium FACHB-63]|nr:helix-turn-helix domain-containing protein [Cyanobacteria bacterium FACHB-63]